MEYDDESVSNKNQLVTLILLLFFGSLGAHRFYAGKYFTGILFLIFGSSQFIFGFLGFGYVFIIRIVFMFLVVVDLYALYSDSFTDSKGNLILGKSKVLVYDTFEERDQKIFLEKMNNIILTVLAIVFYGLYIIISSLI